MSKSIFWEIQDRLDNLIDSYIEYIDKTFFPNLEKINYIPDMEKIKNIQERFKNEVFREIPNDYYEKICGGKKDNRKYIKNSLIFLTRVKRSIYYKDEEPNKNNLLNAMKNILKYINNPENLKKYPYSIVIILRDKAYEIPLIKIVEAYATFIINGIYSLYNTRIPPMRKGKFINEFSMNLNIHPKGDEDNIFIMGLNNQGDFEVESSSPSSKYLKLRKVYYNRERYYPREIQRRELLLLYYLNLLENIRYGNSFYIIVPDKKLLTIYFNILESARRSYSNLPMIFTYLSLHTEILRRRKNDLDSFYLTSKITIEKLNNLRSEFWDYVKNLQNFNIMEN
ncbi:hypothetical protein YN1_8500 [Nanoarchaeota archaeon]